MGNQPTKQHQISGSKPKKYVHWKSAERPSPPGRPILIPISDQQPDVITLKWEKPRSDGGSPILGYIVEHRRLGSPHWVRATPILVTRTEVALSGLEPGWRYQFRTIAENVVGRSDPSELSDALTVTLQRNAITVPRFVSELKDTTAVENQRVEMRVSVVGQPLPEINWFKDGFEIFSSRRTKIVNDNDLSVLIIHQAALTDEGEIKCTATNRAGHVATRAKLRVEAPPKIRLPRQYEDGLIVEAEEVLRLKIAIAGLPAPAVLWQHEGENIRSGGRFELITTDKYSSLKIENVKRADRGEYCIRAINKLGEDVASFLVTVTARPDPPAKVKLKMSFGRSATLTWIAPIDDGGCKIGNYIVEYFRIGWNVWLKASTTRQLTATLHDLIEGSEYKFRVKAENPYGVSDPSGESEILFIPDPKRGITKPVRDEQLSPEQPVPPKRKTLSPLRNFLGVSRKEDERDKSPSGRTSPSVNVQHIPQFSENEDLHREMSYGTSDKALKGSSTRNGIKTDEVKRSPSPSRHKNADVSDIGVNKSPSFNRKEENNLSVNQKIQQFFQRSPSPSRKILSTPEVERKDYKLDSSEKNESKELADERKSPTLVRKNSGRLDQLKQLFRRSPSPCRRDQPSEPEADQNPELQKSSSLQRSEEPAKLSENESPQPVLRLSQNSRRERPNKLDFIGLEIQNVSSFPALNPPSSPRLSLPNPIIEISPPIKEKPVKQSDVDRREDVHTSSEFMLVLYPKKKSKETEKQESFDLELEDALSPPPLSLSSPDLASDMQYLQEPMLRRSASSTELLYERAMARFYEAVELEESGKGKRLNSGQDYPLHEPIRKRLGSISDTERLSFEKRSALRRKMSGDIPDNLASLKLEVKETTQIMLRTSPVPERKPSLKHENTEELSAEDENYRGSSLEYESDYTESTASSASEDSIEKFKIELMARTKSTSGELETYHPRRIEDPNFSPYRSPTPDQSIVVLNKPVPLPNPDFVPKPILKRPSSENSIKDETTTNGKPSTSPEPTKSEQLEQIVKSNKFVKQEVPPEPERIEKVENVEKSEKPERTEKSTENSLAKGIRGFFKKDKVQLDQPVNKNGNGSSTSNLEQIEKNGTQKKNNKNGLNEPQNNAKAAQPVPIKQKLAGEAQKKLETSQSAEEEAKVVAEHYNDIVRELGRYRKSSVPLYMRGNMFGDELEKSEEEERKPRKKSETELEEELMEKYMARPRLSIVERLQVAHVQDRSKLAFEKPREELLEKPREPQLDKVKTVENKSAPEDRTNFSPTASEDNLSPLGSGDNISSRGKRTTRAKVKKRSVAGNRSRKGSNSGSDIVAQKPEEIGPRKRPASRTRVRNDSESPGPLRRKPLQMQESKPSIQLPLYIPPLPVTDEPPKSTEDIIEEAQEKVRSTVSYLTDVGLFIVACWVYIFKDARLVLPILALMVYRQIGEALKDSIPDWLKRKKS